MQRLGVIAVLAVLVAVLPAAAAGAHPPIDAADLAADCNDDGILDVGDDLRVRGGAGTITELCLVRIAAGTSLTLHGVVLEGPGGFVVVDSLTGSRIRVARSTIDLASFVQLSAGCCSGDPSRDESGGRAVVVDSFVRGQTVEVSGSVADASGRATVRRSTLEAVGPTISSVAVHVSLDGRVTVTDSVLIAPGQVSIDSGPDGTTVARRNVFDSPTVIITTGEGGSCRSRGNTPSVPCV